MKLVLFVILLVFSNAQIVKKYPLGTYVKSCLDITVDGNMLCAKTNNTHKWKDCIIFDECSYIENIDYRLIDKRLDNCNTNYQINMLEQKLDLIIKYINLELDMKYRELKDFSQ